MGLDKIESFLGNHIEGFFNRRFASDLEPVELINGIRKEIGRKYRRKGDEGVPHEITFSLSPDDYSRLCARRVQEQLYTEIEKEIILSNTFMDGELSIRFLSSPEFRRGVFSLEFASPKGENQKQEANTIVLDKSALIDKPPLQPVDHKTVALMVIEGPDKEAYLEFGESKIYIGRRDKNEFILTDSNASRLHAWVAYERHRHVIYDARSTNGTFVNDEPVTRYQLNHGDVIKIGANLLKYEVI